MKPTKRTIGLALACAFAFFASCASPKKMQQYVDEVRTLKEERAQLKKENRELRQQNEAYEISLAEASLKPAAPTPVAENSELDSLGIDYHTDRFGNMVFSIPADITFPSGKAELTKKGKEALQVVARTLLDEHSSGRYWIEGHTDSDPIKKSTWESNRQLSVERAMAVLHYLVEDCNVPDDKCVVAGHGQYDPLAANDDNAAKARNRRVEIRVLKAQA